MRRMPFVAWAKWGLPNLPRMPYAHILRSERVPQNLYHGFTTDFKSRLAMRHAGGNVPTRAGRGHGRWPGMAASGKK